jgi:FAD dependent oxidoreductase
MKAAVVGGGLFGCLTAVKLARAGVFVTLFDKLPGPLMGATRANQARIHRGYHYPRDPHMADLAGHADRLTAMFPSAVTYANHYYLLADDSLTDADQYQKAVVNAGLPWEPAKHPLVYTAQACIVAPEAFLDVDETRTIVHKRLVGSGVQREFNTEVDIAELANRFDRVVDATYGRYWPQPLRYEVCETVYIQLGPQFRGLSFVVMDGEYCSLDPRGDLHLLYDVQHSVHAVNHIPDHLAGLLDRGRVWTRHTHLDAMLQTARRFLRGIGMPQYWGSLFTVRAVLPDDGTDARPTLIRTDGNVTRVLSGKLCQAPWAADQIAAQVLP